MKKKITKMLTDKRAMVTKLEASMVESETKEERQAIGETLKALRDEINELEAVEKEMDEPAEETPTEEVEGRATVMATLENRDNTPVVNKAKDEAEARAKQFAETHRMSISTEERAVLISSGQLATPTEVKGINDLIEPQVSSIIDMVDIVNANGMGSYQIAYEVADAEGATTAEGADYNESDPEFAFVTVTPQTETVISYISKQVRRQTPLQYEAKVRASALRALRKRAAAFVTSKILASTLVQVKEIEAIGADTLRDISLDFGGDEGVLGNTVLFLHKKDLVKFGKVRGTNEKKALYEITPNASNPNVGIIKEGGTSVMYCLNKNLAEGQMLYGQPLNFELALFSPYEISASEDFKFNKGLLSIAGDVEFGGELKALHGMMKVTVKG